MTDAAVLRRYNEVADVYIQMFGATGHVDPEDLTFLERNLGQCQGIVLDAGCGPGHLTAGPKESRAWTVRKGATAPEAAGVIHTDFQKGFIKAEIVSYDDLVAAGSMNAAKSAGKVRMEGKDYVMADGDVVEFRFNV